MLAFQAARLGFFRGLLKPWLHLLRGSMEQSGVAGHGIRVVRTAYTDLVDALRQRRGMIGPVVRFSTNRRVFALTFDDGPDPIHTRPLLEVLARQNCAATFFVLGSRCRANSSLLRDIVAGGNEVGLHGVSHRHLAGVPISELRKELTELQAQVQETVQAHVKWYRAPYGFFTSDVLTVCGELGMVPITANRVAMDWEPIAPEEMTRAALILPRRGNVLLMHDSVADRTDGATEGLGAGVTCPRVLAAIIAGYGRRGLRPVTLSRLNDQSKSRIHQRLS